MKSPRKGFHQHFQRHALATAVVLALAGAAQAQLSTATIQGQVSTGTAAAQAGLPVVATNQANGNTHRTTTRADGSYVLAGLAPGAYTITVSGQKSQVITVQVGETAAVDLSLAAAGQQVTIVGSTQRKDVRNSEVGTSVSQKQIDSLPQVSRNFLAFADLAPGVRFDTDPSTGQVSLSSGAQNKDNVNVFIDGVSQKNYILRGGVSGMDSTRGNPFPQSAIAEYKVISQNYKAEFDQVSSAAITAITKSGTNELHGEVFMDRTSNSMVAFSPYEKANEKNGNKRATFTQSQYGMSLGGPIKQDVAHYFVSYEGKDISTPRAVDIVQNLGGTKLSSAGLGPQFMAMQGSHNQNFRENLLFGKIDLELGADQHLSISSRLRREDDLVAESVGLSAPGNDKNRQNNETRFNVKHEWTTNTLVNEFNLGYEDSLWNPHANLNEPEIKWAAYTGLSGGSNTFREFIWTGGSPDAQRREQSGWLFQDDLTYTGLAGHTIKGGAKLKTTTFDLSGTARSVDIMKKALDPITGLPMKGLFPGDPSADYYFIDKALPAVPVKYKNNQFGLYLQDDWKLSKQLELNLGLRWDYESNMLNNDYATPADRVAALRGLDGRTGMTDANGNVIPVAAGQTYAQSLAKGGVNIDDYIANGKGRKAFNGAIAPRLGFSYDLNGDKASVVFAGIGRSYDRTMANHALDEMQKNAVPGGEIWLINNKFKMPFTDQFSLGLRQAVGVWNTELGLTYSHSKNQFTWSGGNRDPQGGFANQSPIDPLWGGPNGYGTLILGDFNTQAKTNSFYLKADKPATKSSNWSAGITYTYSEGKTTNKEWTNDIFNWTAGRSTSGWNPSKDVERHRIVANGSVDGWLPWGLTVSGKATLGSGKPYRITNCGAGWNKCVSVYGEGGDVQTLDLAISKDVPFAIGRFVFRMDVLNLLNKVNYGGYDDWGGGPGNPQNAYGGDNGHVGTPGNISTNMRMVKLTARYTF
ncbi:MAG: TonB-dependent receptor [Ideonella sp.]|nr:TonB-dependent receptor [Ideonella sp.]